MSEPGSGTPSTLVGHRVGDYQILRALGRGGMAEVYAAKHLSLERKVALKVLRRDLARDEDYVKRFRREAKSAARLSHPNIVGVFDVGSANGLHYIAQEFIDGRNLLEVLEKSGPIDHEGAVDVLVSVSNALDQACQAGIIHRDIKPENLIRADSGEIKVADFGLARSTGLDNDSQANLTRAGIALGTPKYMSPEQLQGKPVDTRSDLYSLGVTMYHLLSGKVPFQADDPLALAVMHLHETAAPLDHARGTIDADGRPDLPEWLIAIVDRLMSKSPDDRFQSPAQLLDAIHNETSISTLEGRGPLLSEATIRLQRAADEDRRRKRGRRWQIAAGVGLPFMVAVGTYAGLEKLPKPDATRLIKPVTVENSPSIEEQFLIAVARNDEAGWRAVERYFPISKDASHAKTHRKTKVQLARLMASEGRPVEANQLLGEVLSDPEASLLEQTIALADSCLILNKSGKSQEASKNLDQLRGLYRELIEQDSEAAEMLEQIFPQSARLRLGLTK